MEEQSMLEKIDEVAVEITERINIKYQLKLDEDEEEILYFTVHAMLVGKFIE